MLKLRDIELCGFKSFPDRTRVPLPGDVLVVVGPNGAGKSNVTDAVLWALGEQSAKTLRGHKMMDVIFVGTHKRPASGMAEVLLTFQDGDGTRFQVGRRLLRSGESTYLMDGRPVRLKDMQDFMMRYAISTHGSFLVEQGRVDALLQTNPEERRIIFEEVAGIAHFKENRRTALQKLESTQANLLRINDIIAEVETQMGSLKRQASKADRFVRLSGELRDRRRTFWGRSFGKFTAQRAALSGDLDLFREERERRETALARLSSELEQAGARHSEHETSVADLIQAIHLKEMEAQRMEEENKRRTDGILSARTRLRQLASDREEVKKRIEAAREEAERLNVECQELAGAEEGARAAADQARARVEETKARGESLESAQQALRQRAFALAQEHSHLAAGNARLEEDLRRHGEHEKRLQREEEGLTAREASLEARREELEGQKVQFDQNASAAQAERTAAQAALAETQSALEAAGGELATARQAVAAAESRLKVLVDHEASLRSSAHRFLKEKDPARAGTTLAESLGGVPDAIVPALSAALSGLLDGYLDSEWLGLDEVLARLRGEKAGEAVFLLGGHAPAAREIPPGIAQKPGFLGWLHEAEGLPEALQPRLPLVALAQDAQGAYRMAREDRVPAVSREGLFVHPDGWVRGGAGGPGGASLLEHERERRRSEKALAQDLKRRDAAESRHEGLKAELEQRKVTLAAASAAEEEALRTSTALARDLDALADEARRHASSRTLLEQEMAQAREDRSAWEDQRKESAAGLARAAEAKKAIDEELRKGEEALAAARAEQERLHEGVAETRARLSEVSERFKAAQDARQRARDLAAELVATEARFDREAQGQQGRVESLTGEVTEADRALRTLLLALDESRQRKSRFDEELRTLAEEVQRAQHQVKSAREALDEAREEVNRNELALATVDSDLRNLVERMGEVFEEEPSALAGAYSEMEPLSDEERQEEHRVLQKLEEKINDLGAVNMLAREEYAELEKRFEFLSTQRADLEEAVASLTETIRKINRTTRERFMEAFTAVQGHFAHLFKEVFEGGEARLSLLDEANPLDTGVEIFAQPPGKKLQNLQALSGGEKAMTAIALLFSLFRYRPQPFFILDEVDAALDEANINRFNRLLDQFRGQTQFVVVSHNKRTMEMAEFLYGVTMPEGGVSRVVSVRLAEVEERLGVGRA